MKGKISGKTPAECCEYCGWKFPNSFIQIVSENNDSAFCENCGTEIIKNDYNQSIYNKKRSFLGEIFRNKKDPVDRIIDDSDFPLIFKENLIIVISRLIATFLTDISDNSAKYIRLKEISSDFVKDIEKKLEPFMYRRLGEVFLQNLHKVTTREFENWLQNLQSKLKSDNKYRQNFLEFLRCLINEVYIIISELWDDNNLPKIERIIRDDLKFFFSNEFRKIINENVKLYQNEHPKFPNCLNIVTHDVLSTDFLHKLSSRATHLEAIRTWQQWRLHYDPSVLTKQIKSRVKDSLTFLNSLRIELTGVVPGLKGRNLNAGVISESSASLILGKHSGIISGRLKNVNKKGYFKIALDELLEWKSKLISNTEFSSSINNVIRLIDAYITLHKPVIPLSYKANKLYLFHPFIKEDYFSIIDTKEKAYWLGFIYSDGSIYQNKPDGPYNRFGFDLSRKDEIMINRFAQAIGFSLKYKNYLSRTRTRNGKIRIDEGVTLEFQSDIFTGYLKELGVSPDKTFRISLPDLGDRELNLAFLLGFFDGDGTQGTTTITSGNKIFLEQIKLFYDLPFDVRYDDYGYRLSLGGALFNEMMDNYKNSLPRKRQTMTVIWGKSAKLTEDLLKKLVWEMPAHVIAREHGVFESTVEKILKKFSISKPPPSYWVNRNYLGKENEVNYQEFLEFFKIQPKEKIAFYSKRYSFNSYYIIRNWVYKARKVIQKK
jgi:hypothetical protein